jgi:hypothetical protein
LGKNIVNFINFWVVDDMNNAIKIGKCPGCGKMTKLCGAGCEYCVNYMGERMLKVFDRVRKDPSIAIQCYARLEGPHRERFVEIFGNPSILTEVEAIHEFIITVELEDGKTYDIKACN